MMELKCGMAPTVSADLALAPFIGNRHFTDFLATLYNRLLKVIGTLGIGPAIFDRHAPIVEYRMFTVHCSTAELPRNVVAAQS
jgi:hypothetical protein